MACSNIATYRYKIEEAPPLHRSATSVVHAAVDCRATDASQRRVALKFIRRKEHLQRELFTRRAELEHFNTDPALVAVLGYHVPRPNHVAENIRAGTAAADDCAVSARGDNERLAAVITSRPEPTEMSETDGLGGGSGGGHGSGGDAGRRDELAGYRFVMVMQLCGRSLHETCGKERLAGRDAHRVARIFGRVVRRVAQLHAAGLVHCDIKPRNVLLLSDDEVVLCDMDASNALGAGFSTTEAKLGSSGYFAPEVQAAVVGAHRPAEAVWSAATDVWSLGAVLFELCAGQTLFRLDVADDELVDTSDRMRLLTWHTMPDSELACITFGNEPSATATQACGDLVEDHGGAVANAARHLVRWCLRGDAHSRPTLQEVLDHPFVQLGSYNSSAAAHRDGLLQPSMLTPPQSMQYRFFISHAQADAASTAKALFALLQQQGVHCWYDMNQVALTLDAMRQGVCDSDAFLLILTEHVLTRWFCQQELLTAINEGKPVQLLIEEDPRFNPFDVASWMSGGDNSARSFVADTSEDHARICAAVDAALPNAIVYRRRDYETDAMLRELCVRAGVPQPPIPPIAALTRAIEVFAVCHRGGRSDAMADCVLDVLNDTFDVTEDETRLPHATAVVVLLCEGSLAPGSTSLFNLVAALQQDRAEGLTKDRLVFVCPPPSDGWTFGDGNPDIRNAPVEVKNALSDHEAITFRPPTHDGGSARHEFPAMLRRLLSVIAQRSNIS